MERADHYGLLPKALALGKTTPHHAEREVMKEKDQIKGNETGCGEQRRFFGASYEDGVCIDGFMWDLDSCEEPGGPLYQGGEIPCPNCNKEEFKDYMSEDEE